jgi:hypothetical protein
MDHSCQQARLRGIHCISCIFLFLFHIEETSSLLQLILLLCNSVTYLLITYTLSTLSSNSLSLEFGAYKVYVYPDSFRGESSQSEVVVGSWIGGCWKTGL